MLIAIISIAKLIRCQRQFWETSDQRSMPIIAFNWQDDSIFVFYSDLRCTWNQCRLVKGYRVSRSIIFKNQIKCMKKKENAERYV